MQQRRLPLDAAEQRVYAVDQALQAPLPLWGEQALLRRALDVWTQPALAVASRPVRLPTIGDEPAAVERPVVAAVARRACAPEGGAAVQQRDLGAQFGADAPDVDVTRRPVEPFHQQ